MTKLITFDVWNTLLKPRSYSEQRLKGLEEILQKAGFSISFDEIKHANQSVSHYIHRVKKIENYRFTSLKERLNYLGVHLGISLSDSIVQDIISFFQEIALTLPPMLFEDATSVLEQLRSQYLIGVIS